MGDWISIEDRLPEEAVGILITDGSIVTCASMEMWRTGPYWNGYGFGGYEWEFDFHWKDVTHWQPLPAPPKEDA